MSIGSRDPEPQNTNEPPAPASPPVFGRTLYDTLVHDLLPVLTNPRTGIPIVILAVAVAAILIMFRSDGLRVETPWVGVRVGGDQSVPQSASLKECLAEARRLNKPYAIESITYLIQVEKDELNGQPAQRQSRRIFYTLRSLQPIDKSQDVFEEEIDTHIPHAGFEHWYGTEKEVFHDNNNKQKFKVYFDMAKDDVRTVVTGANFVLPLPFQDREMLDGHLQMFSNQDFEAYPNQSDAICELNMVIESRSLPIQPMLDGAKRYFAGNLKGEDAKLSYDPSSGNGVRTISARWRNVQINEIVGIYFSWPESLATQVQTQQH